MKKIFLLISVFLLTQSVQAGKYFDYDEETQTCLFKKGGKKFETALGNLCIFNKPIKEIKFHENVRVDQRAKVLKTLGFSVLPLIADLSKNSDDLEKDLSLFREMGLMTQIKSLDLQDANYPECIHFFIQRGYCKNRQQAKDKMEKVEVVKDGLNIRDPEIFLSYVKYSTNLESLSIFGHNALSALAKDRERETFRNEFYSKLSDEEFFQNLTKLQKFENLKMSGLTLAKENFWDMQRKAESKRDNFWNLLTENLKEKKLTHLYLNHLRCAFYPKNLKSLGASLKSMDSLKTIFLDQNFGAGEQGNEGIMNLADILIDLKNIEEVSIAIIGFTQKGAFYLLQKIAKHQRLSQLNMCGNYIQGDISDSFFNVMETCPNLTKIAVSGNDVKWPESSEREQRLIKNGWRVCALSGSSWEKYK